MSHVVSMKMRFKDLDSLQKAGEACGLEMVEAKTYRWWGRHVGDYPLPEGFTAQDLGKCDFVLRVKGQPQAYEIGVVKSPLQEGAYELLYDFYGSAGQILSKAIGGDTAPKLRQEYTQQVTVKQMRKQGLRVTRSITTDGKIVLRGRK